MGIPVISSNIKNIVDIMDKHNLGIVVNNELDALDCKQALSALVAMNLNSITLHEIAKKHFIWEKQKETFLNILSK